MSTLTALYKPQSQVTLIFDLRVKCQVHFSYANPMGNKTPFVSGSN